MREPTRNELKELVDAAPVGHVALTAEGDIEWVNRSAGDLLGRAPSDLPGVAFFRLMDPEDRAEFRQCIDAVLDAGGPQTIDLRIVQEDGGRLPARLHLAAARNRDGANRPLWAILMDISDLQKAEAALERSALSAEAAKRTQSEFLANMSHEFRTPLSAIIGFADILKESGGLDEAEKKHLEVIRACGDHLLTLIEEILSLSRIDMRQSPSASVPFSPSSVINHVFHVMRIKANEKSLAFRHETDAPLPDIVRADKQKLTQVLMHLVSNAVKFTGSGAVTVRTGYCGRHGMFRAAVADTGIGIGTGDMDRIFEPFFRSGDRDGYIEGPGLGLAVSKRYVESMDGSLTVRSTPGQGSVFTAEVRLPADDIRAVPDPGQALPVRGYIGGRKRVLLVDDNPDNIALFLSMLEPVGFGVVVAGNGEEAVDIAGRMFPDAVILDFVMPGMDGLDILGRIRGLYEAGAPCPPIIGVSADVVEHERRRRFAAECDDFLFKPVDRRRLLEKLTHHLDLEWEGGDADCPQSTRKGRREAVALPPPDILDRIRDFARRGALNDLEGVLKAAAANDSTLRPFCEAAAGFVDRCDEEGLMMYIQRMETLGHG